MTHVFIRKRNYNTQRHKEREENMKTQGADSHLQARETSEEINPADTLILDFKLPEL